MAWVRLDDGFPEHPKVVQAGDMAAWLYVCGLTYANRQLTNGFIPDAIVPRLTGLKGPVAHAQRLVDVGLWERGESGYQIHDYLSYQPSAQKVADERAANSARVNAFRRRRNGASNEGVTPNGEPSNGGVTPLQKVPQVQPKYNPPVDNVSTNPGEVFAAAASAPSAAPKAELATRASPKPNRLAAVIDLVQAAGVPITATDRDGKAVKGCAATADDIASAYVAAFRGDWDPGGNGWLRGNLALHVVIARLAGYQASKQPAQRNGSARASPPGEYAEFARMIQNEFAEKHGLNGRKGDQPCSDSGTA